MEVFTEASYGDIGVLVTNPENPIKGRIYLFAHQYAQDHDTDGVTKYYNNHDELHFLDLNGNEITTMPSSYSNAGYVEAGDWIGLMGGNGGFKPHIHMEVYEYFDEVVEKHSGLVNGTPFNEIVTVINENIGVTTAIENVEKSINWQRVDPRTVFIQDLFIDNDSFANDTAAIIKQLNEHDEYWPNTTIDKENKYRQFFKPWEKWTKITGAE